VAASAGEARVSSNGRPVCLLTGAAGTLGLALCEGLRDRYDVAAVYRRRLPDVPSQLQHLVDPLDPEAELPENAHPVFAIQADLETPDGCARVVELALARFGRVDLLVNAAARGGPWGPLIRSDRVLDSMEHQFRLNAMVPIRLATEVARRYWRDRDLENRELNRSVVNVSSIAGLRVFRDQGQSVYGASKAALNYMTRAIAAEFGGVGVRVNATAPTGFPHIVPTERVVDTVLRLSDGDMSGQVLVLTKHGEELT
jgi:NAD(P)-dependent dehydrogenase (short-subunit alcohol dehydrogenase family)